MTKQLSKNEPFSLKILSHSLISEEYDPGGGGTPLYYPYRYVPPQRVWFWPPFGLKTGTDFAHFGLESFMGYKEVYVVYECVLLAL